MQATNGATPRLHKSSSAAALDDLIGSSLSSISRDGSSARGAGGAAIPPSVTLNALGASKTTVPLAGAPAGRTDSTGTATKKRLGELAAALSEPAVDKFLRCSVEDLTMVDIPVLLSDYKRMARVVARVQGHLSDLGLSTTDP
eukprot:m.13653 g.13653  ORF g.13653 m.13653 type:complete len:143 (+) comp10170_c0_seq4:1575-2003(+)